MFKPSDVWHQITDYLSNKPSQGTALIFGINAFLFGNWSVRMPDFKAQIGMNDAEIGIALLASPIGALIAARLCSLILARHAVGKIAFWSVIALICSAFVLGLATTYSGFVIGLFLLGLSSGSLDITMNGVVTALELEQNKVMMSRSHGFWSLGAMFGSLTGSMIAGFGLSLPIHLGIVMVVCLLVMIPYKTHLTPVDFVQKASKKLVWPSTRLWLLIVIIFMMFMIEGGVIQWNSLFYNEALHADEYLWGVGFGVFAFFMAYARFVGDAILSRWQPTRIALICSITVAFGILLFALSPNMIVATIAMGIVGAFTAVMVPIVFREAARDPKVPASSGITLASMFGYSGFLIGPPLLGFVSNEGSIRSVYFTLALLMIVVIAASYALGRKEPE